MKTPARILTLSLLTMAFAAATFHATAESTNKTSEKKISASTKKESATGTASKQTAGPFRGKLAALDKSAKTVTVGKRTFQVTSDTKIVKGGKPATLDDGVVGEEASGGFKTGEDGKLVATKLTFGPKVESKTAGDKKTR